MGKKSLKCKECLLFDNALPFNFLGLNAQLSAYETSKVVILPVMYDGTVTYRTGTREAPLAVIQASRYLEPFDGEILKDSSLAGITTLPPMCGDTSGPEKMLEKVESVVQQLITDKKFPIMIGGDHSLTVAPCRAFSKEHNEIGILQIDAHLDLRNVYDGSNYNHACAMRRISEFSRVVPVGIRSLCAEEYEYVTKNNIQVFYGWDIRKNKDWIPEVVSLLPEKVYITIDLDGLDPSIIPAVGTPEPGGLLWEDVTMLLAEVCRDRTVVGADFVELCPIPGNIAPDFITSKLIYRLIGLVT